LAAQAAAAVCSTANSGRFPQVPDGIASIRMAAMSSGELYCTTLFVLAYVNPKRFEEALQSP
jgi:hypothetical protein